MFGGHFSSSKCVTGTQLVYVSYAYPSSTPYLLCVDTAISYAKWPDANASCVSRGARLPLREETTARGGPIQSQMENYTWTGTGTTNNHYLWRRHEEMNGSAYGPEGFQDTWANLPYRCVYPVPFN